MEQQRSSKNQIVNQMKAELVTGKDKEHTVFSPKIPLISTEL